MAIMENLGVLWAFALMMSAVASSVATQNLTGVPCSYEETSIGLKVDCSHRSLSAIPRNLSEETVILDIDNNRLTKLTNKSFSGLPRLFTLNLQSNNISRPAMIESGTFHPLALLNSINLANNNLTSLPSDLFSKNLKLQVVQLSNNRLSSFPGNVLNSVTSLRLVDLSSNLMISLNLVGFKGRNLSTGLMMKYNYISAINKEDFLPLRNTVIERFTLSYNNLTSLTNGVFQYLEGVRDFRMIKNNFHNFSVLPFMGMMSLQSLRMGKNEIRAIIPLPMSFNQTKTLPPLLLLDLQGNRINTIPSRAFWGLSTLLRLDIHQSRIKTLLNDSFEGLDSLEALDLTGNSISYVTNSMFNKYCPGLRSLILPNSHLTELNAEQFGNMVSLERLDLARGTIRFIRTSAAGWHMPALKFLDISYNRLTRLDKKSFYGMTNLTFLNISNNQITIFENSVFASTDLLQELKLMTFPSFGSNWTPFSNLHELTTLYLSNTHIKQLTHRLFTGLTNLRRLYLQNCELSAVSFWDPMVKNVSVLSNLSTLEYLTLKGNNLDKLIPGTFRGLHNLNTLYMDSCNIEKLNGDIFENLTMLRNLYIDKNPIKELTSQHFKDLPSLVGVSIKSNEIKDLAIDVFAANPHISYLYISHNHLTTIKEGTILPKATLDMSYNPFVCNCELIWLLDWLDKESVSIIHPDQTNCSQVSLSNRNRPILEFNPKEVCGPRVVVIIISTFVIVTCAVVCIVAYQRRWLINYKCFHFKLFFIRKQGDHDGRERLDYEYDINLAFDDDDEEWVRGVLKPGLEERLPEFDRIVCGDDDLPLGMFYIDAITEVTEQSYKTILVVSNRAVDNHGFISKLRLAVDHMNEVELEKTILIFKEDIPDGHLPYLVRLFLSKNKPYFLWAENEYRQRLMWDKLVKELEFNRKMNDVLPI